MVELDLEIEAVKVHEGEELFNCHFCDVEFDLKIDLEKHISAVHESKNAGLKKDKILRIIQCLNEASDIASEFDTDYQRVLVFRNGLNRKP